MKGTPSNRWQLTRNGDAAALVAPDGATALVARPQEPVDVLGPRLTGLLSDRRGAPVSLPDASCRLAFALGAQGGWTVEPVATVRVDDVRGARENLADEGGPQEPANEPSVTPAPPSQATAATPRHDDFHSGWKQLRLWASWYGATDPRVLDAKARLSAHPAAPRDVAIRVDRAVSDGARSGAAFAEIERLGRTHGANSAIVSQRVDELARELGFPEFTAVARKKLDKLASMQARAKQAQTSSVRASPVDHRIPSLSPSPRWTLAIDEGGDIPARLGDMVSGHEGRFVGLLVPESVTLAALDPGWHAVEQTDHRSIDAVVQRVLDAPVGVLGLTLSALARSTGDAWVTGVLELIHWVCRLLPLGDGATTLSVEVEQRGEWVDGPAWSAMATGVLRSIAEHDPERASRLTLSLRLVRKGDAALDGYVDALAFTWTSPHGASRARLAQSGLRDACLVSGDAPTLRTVRDALVYGADVPADVWRALVRRPEAHIPGTFLAGLLDQLRAHVRRDPAQWHRQMESVRTHLDSKAIRLSDLGREIAFLASCAPTDVALSAPARLVWATARLEAANHRGAVDVALDGELDALVGALFDEEPALACQADLDRAVLATNRFEFEAATRALARWSDVPAAVPGLRHWGRVQSSLGQHAAFRGDPATALAHFDRALGAFARLSDRGASELAQTATYAAIAATDHASLSDEDVRARVAALLPAGLSPAAVAGLAADVSPTQRYAHHAVLRWISRRGDVASRNGYLSARDRWASGTGHPWSLIELHRALLLRDLGEVDAARRHLAAAIGAAAHDEAGPTVSFIAVVCAAAGVCMNLEAPTTVEDLVGRFPAKLPQAPWEPLREALAGRWKGDARAMIARCLPFNFG